MEGQLKILIAGVDPAVVRGVDAALEHAGLSAELVRVDDGEEAVRALGRCAYDCALLDSMLPEPDGLAVLGEASKKEIGTPVILLTGGNGGLETPKLLEASAFDCVGRDQLEDGRLSRTLRNAARLARAERQADRAEELLAHQAMHDPLTGLPNRVLFDDRLKSAIALGAREDRQVAVLVVDLNRFGEINKTLSHGIGDLLLDDVASRLQRVLRSSDTVARLAGDEFGVLLSTGASLAGAVSTAGKIIDAVKEPVVLGGHRLAVGVSIGVAVYPTHGSDAAGIVRHAGMAMAEAKHTKSGFAIFAGADENESLHKMSLAGDLHQAVENAEFVLHYQPVVSVNNGRACGAEALLRWQHPQHGMLSPVVFIPLAERTGEIEPLTLWILDSAIGKAHAWQKMGYEIPISVNISAATLHNPEFSDQVAAILRKWNVPVDLLKLEITESSIISDVARATETLNRLNRMGVRISIDDFGAGYTSIANLRRFPVAEVKIDKSYVLNMTDDTGDAFVVCSIIELGHNLGLKVIAEGVEDQETWDMLAGLGCDAIQGFYVSRPIDAASFEAWMAEQSWDGKNAAAERACASD